MSERIRILFTSDVHGAVLGTSYATGEDVAGSFARLATLIGELRDEHSLLIDGGDTLEGSPLSSYHRHFCASEPYPATRAMAALNYDYYVLGNHDFSYGREALELHRANCGARDLTANVYVDGTALAAPYTIRNVAGRRLALVGTCTHFVPRWEPPHNLRGISFDDAFELVAKAVELARTEGGAELVVVVYHGGFERNPQTGEPYGEDNGENQALRMLTTIPGIDVLLSAHQHRVFCGATYGPEGKRVCYVQPGYKGSQLACVDIDVQTGEALARLIEVDTQLAQDTAFAESFAAEEAACQRWLDEPLGSSQVDLRIHDVFAAEKNKSPFVTLLNLVQAEATGAQVSATALFPGCVGLGNTITMRDVVSSYPVANTLTVKKLSGATLKSYLEKCAEYFDVCNGELCRAPAYTNPDQDFNYDMLDGLSYTLDINQPPGSRVLRMEFEGKPVSVQDELCVVVNNYRAAGGGGFPMIAAAPTVSEQLDDMVELVARYIQQHSPLNFEPEHNIELIYNSRGEDHE